MPGQVAVLQGTINVPVYDLGFSPGGGWLMPAESWQPSFTGTANGGAGPLVASQFNNGQQNAAQITGLNVLSGYNKTLTDTFNFTGDGFVGGGPGASYGDLYWMILQRNGWVNTIGWQALAWNPLASRAYSGPIVNKMQPITSAFAGATRTFVNIFNTAFYGYGGAINGSNAGFILWNPYYSGNLNNAGHTEIGLSGTYADAGASYVLNIPDYYASQNYTLAVDTFTTPHTYYLTQWPAPTNNLVALQINVAAPQYRIIFDDPNIPALFPSGNYQIAATPGGFLFINTGLTQYKTPFLYLSKDGARYWWLNVQPQTGGAVFWQNNVNGLSNTLTSATIDINGVLWTTAYSLAGVAHVWNSYPLSINFNLPFLNLPTETPLPCMTPCMGMGFEPAKIYKVR